MVAEERERVGIRRSILIKESERRRMPETG